MTIITIHQVPKQTVHDFFQEHWGFNGNGHLQWHL